MIIVLKPHVTEEDVALVTDLVASLKYRPRVISGVEQTVIACIGDELSNRSLEVLADLPCVDRVLPIQHRYKLVSREYHTDDTVVEVGGRKIGGKKRPEIIAGPCAIESYDQFRTAVRDLTAMGIGIIRAMPYKPRTSPYDFQGLREEGLRIMKAIKAEFPVAFVSELLGPAQVEQLAEVADVLQIGARNAQNYDLLEIAAKAGRPVLLKRGMSSTVEEWLAAAEYLAVNGCNQVMLCERGIRSFDPAMRNLLDVGAIALARQRSHLPVLADPSHAAGHRHLVFALACAALGAGADGLVIEAHPDPVSAFSDASQQIETGKFTEFLSRLDPWLALAEQQRHATAAV